jgi:hypothetical protein
VSKATGTGVRALKARIKKEITARNIEARAAAMKAATDTDGRIVRPRPEFNGELSPTITFLDGVLVNDTSEEPPMRNASGALVRVEEKEPWALHLLTSNGANAANDNVEAMGPPSEPVLVELTTTGVEFLLENYVRWVARKKDGSTYSAALPKPFIVALMEDPNSTLPVVRVINTSPLVTMSGHVIDGVGLDRDTGLVHRIDPVLRESLPADKPTDEEIKQALAFLLDEWLVDVTLDRVGKCVAIMLALTVLERALLPERPAFFVTAGQRGGGKTTLIMMIIAAVLGRRPAAAAWSDSVEERKKALFAYLRQSVAALVWDNIARGSTISCPHIEAAITAPEISDRVLGVSEAETVPATTVQIFTGNSIGPRGDMASRSFVLSLNVDRPDPENRDFKNADALAWTQQNRIKILTALYTILIGGALRRPDGQTAKTRFKPFWSLIGWPVEYAADLLDIKLDCTELLRSGEAEDEEASAASRALTILSKRWRNKVFTAQQVVLALNAADSMVEESAEQAQELEAALGELAGKPIDKPTARGIGKLFQKYLTNRPAFIDGGATAVLQKVENHQANQYTVEIKEPAGYEQPGEVAHAAAAQSEPDPFGDFRTK